MIKAVDREQWITLSKIAVPLRACTAMAAEIAAASVLTEVIDLRLTKKWETFTNAPIRSQEITEPVPTENCRAVEDRTEDVNTHVVLLM